MSLYFNPINDNHDPVEDLLNLNDRDDEVEAELVVVVEPSSVK